MWSGNRDISDINPQDSKTIREKNNEVETNVFSFFSVIKFQIIKLLTRLINVFCW